MSEHERLQWEIIASKFSKDSNGLLALLGINRKDVIQETEIFTGKKRENLEEKNTKRKESFHEQVSFAELSALDAENFFNKAGASHVVEKQPSPTRRQAEIDFSRVITETISRNIN